MRLAQLGYEVRRARLERGLTQQQLAAAAGLSRTTLNQLESGRFPDLGFKKVQAILEKLGMSLTIDRDVEARPDFLKIAATTANVSFRSNLSEDELIRALLTGEIPQGKRPHLRMLLDEVSPKILQGLVEQLRTWVQPDLIEINLNKISAEAGATRKIGDWLKTA